MTVHPTTKKYDDLSGFQKFIRADKTQRVLLIVSFMFVPLVLLMMFTYIPFAKMVQFSFYNRNYLSEGTWVGLQNYIEVFKRSEIFGSLRVSLYYMGGAVVQLVLALFFASLMVFKVKGEGIYKACMFFPYLICGIAVGFIFKFFYTRGFVFDTVLQWCGFNLESLPFWLKDKSVNNISLVASSVWRYYGNNMVLFIGAIMSVDSEMYEAAELDGANKFQQFIHIILPSIKTIVTLNVILSITGSLSAFDPPYVITKGGGGTATYFVLMDKIAHTNQQVGLASAMAVVLLLIIFAATILQKLFFKLVFRSSDADNEEYTRRKRLRRERRWKKEAV